MIQTTYGPRSCQQRVSRSFELGVGAARTGGVSDLRGRRESRAPVEETLATVVELPAGGYMFHHCLTLHHTKPNRTDRQRRAFAIHFMTPGTRDSDGDIMPVPFARPSSEWRSRRDGQQRASDAIVVLSNGAEVMDIAGGPWAD